MKFEHSIALFQHLFSIDEEKMLENLPSLIKQNEALFDEVTALINAHYKNKNNTEFKILISEKAEILVNDESIHKLAGTQVGVYKLTQKLGDGGMGAVYLGERNDGQLEQKVAIKFVYPSITAIAGSDFLKKEAQHLANVEHINIAKIYTIESTDNGMPYMVMEYIDGLPLDQFCDEHHLNWNARLRLFQKVCHAVHAAHQNMVIHADIKPSNILVDKQGEPKLMDFGIACFLQEKVNASDNKKVFRAASGYYASPEQLKGHSLSTASDIYSAGKILKLLVDRPLNTIRLQKKWCLATINQCLQEDPNKRIPSFDQLADGIVNLLHYSPPAWVTSSSADKVNTFYLRNTSLSYALITFSVITGLFFYSLVNKNTLLNQQNESNEKVISFLTRLFQDKQNEAESATIFELLKIEESEVNRYEESFDLAKNSPFSPFIFRNHSATTHEKIKLKIEAQYNKQPSNFDYQVIGNGTVSEDGFYQVSFDSVGVKKVIITAKNNVEEHTQELNFIIRDELSMPFTFADIPPQDPNFADIHYLALEGIIIGRPISGSIDRVFSPEQYVKQAEALKIIMMAAHTRHILTLKKSQSTYKNLIRINSHGGVEDFRWAATFIDAAIDLGILTNAIDFTPKKLTTRNWMSHVLVKTLNLYNPELLMTNEVVLTDRGNFSGQEAYDIAKITAFYNLLGNSHKAFLPSTPLTRREVAIIAAKILQIPTLSENISSHNGSANDTYEIDSNQLPNLQTPGYRREENTIIVLDKDDVSLTKIEFKKALHDRVIFVVSNKQSGVMNSISILKTNK